MSRVYGKDILNDIETLLTADFNNLLLTIATERSLSQAIPPVINFETGWAKNQFPECLIYLLSSSVDIEELTNDIDLTTEVYTGEVTIAVHSNNNLIFDWVEYYIEALKRVLHGYTSATITWLVVTGDFRQEFMVKENQSLKICGVEIEVRIN